MKKRIIFGFLSAGGALLAILPLAAAFEAHIINVTGSISNAIGSNTYSMDFGTVFPQEKFEKTFQLALSESFLADKGFDDVEYVLRQKPKCQLNATGQLVVPTLPPFGQVEEDGEGNFLCQDEAKYDLMPFLCPYLSKSEISPDGIPVQNDMGDVPIEPEHLGPLASFHGPKLLAPPPGGWDMNTTLAYQLQGRMAKSDEDLDDEWLIDLKVPCFEGHCAQDWETFFLANGGTANGHTAEDAEDYIQPGANEHAVFGCDLWIEVTELSTPPNKGTLIIKKLVINDDGGTTATTTFTYQVNAGAFINFESDGMNTEVVDPGQYSIIEPAFTGYATTYVSDAPGHPNDCTNLDVAVNQFVTCTITNNDQAATLIVNKLVINNDNGVSATTTFQFQVNGGGAVNFEADGSNNIGVTPGLHSVVEVAAPGYQTTYSNSLNGNANCDNLNIPNGGTATCNIVNNDEPPVLACNATLDLMLVLDRSGSINATELLTMKNAAHSFIDVLSPTMPGAHTGQSSFSTTATLDKTLSGDEGLAHLAINSLSSGGQTDLESGITSAISELGGVNDRTPDLDANFPDYIVVITDGEPNQPDTTQGPIDAANAADAARTAGIEVFVVGVGVTPATETFLQTDIADDLAHYFAATDFTELQALLQQIVSCEANRTILTYAGVTTANDGVGGRPIAFEHDSDVWPWTTFSDVNSSTTPDNGEYVNITTDNDTRWNSGNPGGGDFMVKNFRFFASTTPVGNIDDIKITWKGQPDGLSNTTIWALKTGFNPLVASSWVQIGGAESIPADTDEYIVRHIADADVETYVNASTGRIDFMVAIDNDNEVLRTDYIQLLITSSP